jgi:hypothetical protein
MKTLIAVCVLGLGLAACDEHMKNKSREEAVDRTQTTSALIVDPTLRDSHAAQPMNESPAPSSDMDVENIAGPMDEVEAVEARDGG